MTKYIKNAEDYFKAYFRKYGYTNEKDIIECMAAYNKENAVPEFIVKIDWSELRNQKASLLSAIEKAEQTGNDEFVDHLNGILSLIDAVQDYAVDTVEIVKAVDVYDFELEDGEQQKSVVMSSDRLEGETDEQYFARTVSRTIFETQIEGSFLYEHGKLSRADIESVVDDLNHAEKIIDIIRLAILKDVTEHPETFNKNENGQYEYDYTMYDYGEHITEYCEKVFNINRTKIIWICSNCGSDNIEGKVWKNLNTGELDDSISSDEEDCWCNGCEGHYRIDKKEIPL